MRAEKPAGARASALLRTLRSDAEAWLYFALLLLLTVGAAHAQACKETPLTVPEVQSAVTAGIRLHDVLEQAEGAELAVVARVGSDQRKRGMRYTHAALFWRDHPQGRWHATHLLNPCGTDRSDIFDDGPVNFFFERPFSYDTLVVIPSHELQRAVVGLLTSTAIHDLHTPRYSALAHPFEQQFQNSNQWLLEIVATALDALRSGRPPAQWSRQRAQEVLKTTGYVPERTRLGFFERVGARRLDNVSLRDHRRSELREGGYQWVSVRSIVRYLERLNLIESQRELPAEDRASRHQRPVNPH